MPHLHRIVQALFEPAQVNGPWLIDILWHASLFTAKEALLGFAIGALVRLRDRGAARRSRAGSSAASSPTSSPRRRSRSSRSRRWSSSGSARRACTDWVSVAVLAAYLTFFPVTINTLRGLESADPRARRADALLRRRPLGDPLEAARADLDAVPLLGVPDRGAALDRRRDHLASPPPRSRAASAARSSTSTSTTRSSRRSSGRRTSSPRCSGSSSSSASCWPRSSSCAARRSTCA